MGLFLGILDGTPGVSSPLEILLFGMGAASTCAAFAAILWRIAKPHAARYIESIVRPIVRQVEQVREEVKPNHGESLHDRAIRGAEAAQENSHKLDRAIKAIHRIDGKLDAHMTESRDYLATAQAAFEAQGIRLPDPPEEYGSAHEESERSRRAGGR